MSFKPAEAHSWQSYATVSHDKTSDVSLYVTAERDTSEIRLAAHLGWASSSVKLTAERARELAAELIAAAESLQTVAEAA